jgi:hypothetical protein
MLPGAMLRNRTVKFLSPARPHPRRARRHHRPPVSPWGPC